jgi:ammonium transporter, Amt family
MTTKERLAEEAMGQRIDVLADILDTVWVVIVGVMVILAQAGFMMKETGSIKMKMNSVILLKTILVVAMSSLTFFVVGFGFSVKAGGGILGQDNFIGVNFDYNDYTRFIYYLSLCAMMATIATCSIAERTNTDTYIFFSFVTSGFIFPVGLAWCWNNGWLVNIGFQDHGGAGIVHIMGGVAGFVGTYLIGPRVGLFSGDE